MSNIVITDQQSRAIKTAKNWYKTCTPEMGGIDHFSLQGYAGSGKSTILPYIIDECGLHTSDVAFCAPTGKAAKVMADKMGGTARTSTIHSLIYTPTTMKIDQLVSQLDTYNRMLSEMTLNGAYQKSEYEEILKKQELAKEELHRAYERDDGPNFSLNLDSRVTECKLIVVDESSMVDHIMADDLKKFGVPVLAMGDSGQLPPVNGRHGLIKSGDRVDFFLSEIHRQALDNPIIAVATMAREGTYIDFGSYGDTVRVLDSSDDDATTNPDSNAMVLCGTHKKRWRLTSKIRKAFGYTSLLPEEGEPLIISKNYRKNDALLYVNGETAVCMSDSSYVKGDASFRMTLEDSHGEQRDETIFQGLFEEHHKRLRNHTTASKEAAYKSKTRHVNLDWAWTITTHKAQGSQWDDVVVHDESWAFKQDSDRWLYTAITRAAENLTIVR